MKGNLANVSLIKQSSFQWIKHISDNMNVGCRYRIIDEKWITEKALKDGVCDIRPEKLILVSWSDWR
jgi:hypothetical protein